MCLCVCYMCVSGLRLWISVSAVAWKSQQVSCAKSQWQMGRWVACAPHPYPRAELSLWATSWEGTEVVEVVVVEDDMEIVGDKMEEEMGTWEGTWREKRRRKGRREQKKRMMGEKGKEQGGGEKGGEKEEEN